MYPDLLGIFGVTLFGTVFERILWLILSLLMIWGIVSSILIYRKGKKSEGTIQGIIVAIILVASFSQFIATFGTGYTLVFHEPLVLHTYAFMILIGIILGTLTAMKMAPRRGLLPNDMARLCILLVVFGFIGARAAHVIVEAPTYWNSCFDPIAAGLAQPDCLRWLNVSEGGLTFYGGVIAGIVVLTVFYLRRRKVGVDMFSVYDLLSPALAIAHGFGRIGCLAAGCCWGAVTTGSWGIRYPVGSFAYLDLSKNPEYSAEVIRNGLTPALHATQLYEACGELALYAILWTMLLKKTKRCSMIATWFIGYGVLRFFIEMMRDDTERGFYFEKVIPSLNTFFHVDPYHTTILSTSQGIALVMIALGITFLIMGNKLKAPDHKTEQPVHKTDEDPEVGKAIA